VDLTFVSLAEKPELREAMWAIGSTWPEFMLHDPIANLYYPRLADTFPEHQVLGVTADGKVVARINSVPFRWSGNDEDLPDRGWDAVMETAFNDAGAGAVPAISLLEARIAPDYQGSGLSARLLQAAIGNARRLGAGHLFGPVRPTGKPSEPRTPMTEYVERTRGDGLPADPWLRTHVRIGGRIVRVCPLSMTIAGTLDNWREWTGLPLATTGLLDVPGALAPVHVSVEQNHAVYVEPNVWVHHQVRPDVGAQQRH
jgi:GNAT superfamily N-acetyltransferase